MESVEQVARPRFDRKFVGWHVFYTVILTAWGCLLANPSPHNELGTETGYWILAIGALPSLILTVMGVVWPLAAYRLAMVYAGVLAVGTLVLVGTTANFLWVVVVFPVFGFIVEGVVLHMSRNRIFSR